MDGPVVPLPCLWGLLELPRGVSLCLVGLIEALMALDSCRNLLRLPLGGPMVPLLHLRRAPGVLLGGLNGP